MSLSVLVFYSHSRDITVKWLAVLFERAYFKIKFKLDETKKRISLFRESAKGRTRVKKILYLWLRVKAYRFCLKTLYYLITAFKSSGDAFETIKDEVHHFQEEAWHLLERHEKQQTPEYFEDLKFIHSHKHARIKILSGFGFLAASLGSIIAGLVFTLVFPAIPVAHGYNYNWTQTDWSGGESALTATHDTDRTGWTKYLSSDNDIATSTDLTLKIAGTNSSINFDTEGEYDQQDAADGTYFGGGEVQLQSAGGIDVDLAEYSTDNDAQSTFVSSASYSSQYPPENSATYVKATSILASPAYDPWLSTDNTQILTGDWTSHTWLGNGNSNQRYHIDLGSAKVINRIYYENGHSLGGNTGAGVKNFILQGSNEASAFAETTYANDTNWTTISSGLQMEQHAAGDAADPKYITVNNGTAYRYYALKIADNWSPVGFTGFRRVELQSWAAGSLAAYSEASIKTEGSYAVKGVASITESLNGTLTRTFSSPVNLTGIDTLNFDIRSSRTGSNIKIGIHDSGGVTTEMAPAITGENEYQTASWDISAVSSANKDGIDRIIFTIINADAANTFYLDNIITPGTYPTAQSYYVNTAAASQADVSAYAHISDVDLTETTPAGTSIKYLVSFDNRSTWKYFDGSSWQITTLSNANLQSYGMEKAAIEAVTQPQWEASGGFVAGTTAVLDFAVDLKTTDETVTPSLDNIAVNYQYYPTGKILTSSYYNSDDAVNVLGGVVWTQDASLPVGTGVKIYAHASSSSALLATTDWSEIASSTAAGFLTSGCTDAGGEITCTSAVIPAGMKDGAGNQWIQYKIEFISSGVSAPTVSEISLVYVVNASPVFENAPAASQDSSGLVNISYSIKDADTVSSAVTPVFAYSLNDGSSWTTITGGLSDEATTSKAVNQDAFASYSATWDPTAMISSYSAAAKIKVTVDDEELANGTTASSSVAFILDAAAPSPGANPVLIVASTTPAAITLSATDDSDFTMRIAQGADSSACEVAIAAASYDTYNSTLTLALTEEPATVCAQFKDAFSNTSAIQYGATPDTPAFLMIQDVSNVLVEPAEYRLFMAWKVVDVPTPGFARYELYRSSDNVTFTFLASIDSRSTNYYMDSSAEFDTIYYYKMATVDLDGNVSAFSDTLNGKANGAQDAGEGGGGTGTTPPVISNVLASSVYSTQATIVWDTDNLSDSRVDYISRTGGDFTSAPYIGVASMLNNAAGLGMHSVTLTNLSPSTTYYFRAASSDVSGNISTSTSGDNGYSFATLSGPVISNVAIDEVSSISAKIKWNTDVEADSYVIYSTNSDLSSSQTAGSADFTTNHSVSLTGLTSGTRYYLYVRSSDTGGGTSYDQNIIDGVIEYYSFSTITDITAPVISNVIAATITDAGATIVWETNELATSQIEYGLSDTYDTLSSKSATLTYVHSVSLSGLTNETEYHYAVASVDASGNAATSTDYTFTTTKVPGQIVLISTVSGGGGCSSPAADIAAPKITDIKVSGITETTAKITWSTNEKSDSFVNYGQTVNYDNYFGNPNLVLSHSATLTHLSAGKTYHFKVLGKDVSGNLGSSADQTFIADSSSVSSEPAPAAPQEEFIVPAEEEDIVSKMKSFYEQIQGIGSLGVLNQAMDEAASRVMGPPLIAGGSPDVKVGSDWAEISWITDRASNSIVAYAQDQEFEPKQENPYVIESGDVSEQVTSHKVILPNLKSAATYHFQVRSKGTLGDWAKSNDKIFTTLSPVPEVSDLKFDSITENSASISYKTNLPVQSTLVLTNTVTGQTITKESGGYLKEHKNVLDNLGISMSYNLKITVKDEAGHISKPAIMPFVTSPNSEPPKISDLRVSSSLIPGKIEKVQTIISWKTNKPSTSKVYYSEGITKDKNMSQFAKLDPAFVMDHVVITTVFKPGLVYRLRAQSTDSLENIADSSDYTILTPRSQASVIDLIIENFQSTFGFLRPR